MTTTRKIFWTIGVSAILGASIFLWQYLVFVRGTRWARAVGGQWEISYRDTPMHHGGPEATLFRRRRWRRTPVQDLILATQYYGEDCIAFETSRERLPSYFFACGDRQPLLLGRREYISDAGAGAMVREWMLRPDGIFEVERSAAHETLRTVPLAEIKRRAMSQPAR
jgi:hypothetical protein